MAEPDHTPALLRVLHGNAGGASRGASAGDLRAHEGNPHPNPGSLPFGGRLPSTPRHVDDTGLSEAMLVDLLLKTLFVRGQLRLPDLAAHLGLAASVLDPLLTFLRAERLCDMSRRGETDASLTYVLTENGSLRAQDYLRRNQYVGPAPVSLQSYVDQVRRQSVSGMRVERARLAAAFEGIVVQPAILEQFGTAMNSGRAIFVYGPPGSGKTFISEHLVHLLSGHVAVPHAVAVDGEIIQVFDPLVHRPIPEDAAWRGLDLGPSVDRRWVLCERPVVRTGAELTLPMVDLQFDQESRFYQAPPQVKANNGLFIIDDLGRQIVPAQALMNRWIVPLDRHIDFLALHTGTKFMVPFDVIVVFSSNLKPSDLADEAFLRRLGYKIYIGHLNETDYRAIFRQTCAEFEIPYDDAAVDDLLREHHAKEERPLLACLPRDLLEQIRDRARFSGNPPELTHTALDWAWNNYFARH